jgi:Holliday junction DNA helicase RuvA
MITRLRGTLLSKALDRIEVLTPMGIGYECWVSASTFERLPPVGHEVSLCTAVWRRDEGADEMYAFLDPLERKLFLRLQAASGVGPRLALAMVGAWPPARLVQAIREKDVARLRTLPGVGRKKAERIVLELQERLDDLVAEAEAAEAPAPAADDAVAALVALGYAVPEAERAVRRALQAADGRRLETAELVKSALAHLR